MVSKNLSLEENLSKINKMEKKEILYLEEDLARVGKLLPKFDDLAQVLYQRVVRMHQPDFYSRNKEAFAHSVISHSFMDFCKAQGIYNQVCADENFGREIYDKFTEINNIPTDVRELGWQEFLND